MPLKIPERHKEMFDLFSSSIYRTYLHGCEWVDLRTIPEIQKVHFNAPFTTIVWTDKTHTTVKCADDDKFNPRVGFLYAYAKKCFGKSGRQFAQFMQEIENNYNKSLKKSKSESGRKRTKRGVR